MMCSTFSPMVVLTTLVCYGKTIPIPENSYLPWSRLCRPLPSSHDVTQQDPSSSSLSMNELATSVHILTSEALDLAQTLRNEIFQHRLNSNLRMASYLDAVSHRNFPVRSDVMTWTHADHTGDIIRKHYRHVSFLLAFLELTKESSAGSSYRTDGVLQHVNNLEEKLYELLCHMMTAVVSLNLNIESHVTRDEIPEQLSEITNLAVINSRDFIITKDAVHLLSGLKESHSLMRSGYQ